jgi:hypothetical protein
MTEPRKPIFGFLWPKPDPQAPVDDRYRQVRRVRVCGRGPIRIAALVVGTLVLISLTGSLIMTALAISVSLLTVAGAALSASALVLVLRGWVVGTYVNDEGLSIETTWRRVTVAWPDVAAIDCAPARAPFLGLPLRTTVLRSVVRTADGSTLPTHVYESSPDLWLRPEAFDMARIRIEQWHRAT